MYGRVSVAGSSAPAVHHGGGIRRVHGDRPGDAGARSPCARRTRFDPVVAAGGARGMPALQHETAEAPVDRIQIGREANVGRLLGLHTQTPTPLTANYGKYLALPDRNLRSAGESPLKPSSHNPSLHINPCVARSGQ